MHVHKDKETIDTPDTSSEVLNVLAEKYWNTNQSYLSLIAKHPNASYSLLRKIILHKNKLANVYLNALRNTSLDGSLLFTAWQLKDASFIPKKIIIKHPNCPAHLLWLALWDSNLTLRDTALAKLQANPILLKQVYIVGLKLHNYDNVTEDLPLEWVKKLAKTAGFVI